jgi:hypothetical protein
VVFRPVEGLEPLEFWVAFGKRDERAEVREFARFAVSALRVP